MDRRQSVGSVPLADGRRLAYEELGDPNEAPSRCALLFHSVARGQRLRLIAPSRPGIGGSTFQRSRRIVDRPSDVAALADRLHVERFLVAIVLDAWSRRVVG